MFRRVKKLSILCCVTLIMLFTAVIGVIALTNSRASAQAATKYSPSYIGQYTFYFNEYDVTYDVAENRVMTVTEKLVITFTGTESTGFIKYIPVNADEQVRNIKVCEITSADAEIYVPYSVYSETVYDVEYICVDIGSNSLKTNQTHTYIIDYEYKQTTAEEGDNIFYLNAIGIDRQRGSDIVNATVTLILPDGYKDGYCYAGGLYDDTPVDFIKSTADDGRTELILKNAFLKYDEGVTFKLLFDDGALSTYFDFTPYWFVLAGLAILAILIAVKYIRFNRSELMPIVNFEAPDGMDPLIMGKLIDNKVDNEDITSMLYYWADKGYLKINLDDKNNPSLIRIVQKLPDSAPDYEKDMFNSLFSRGEIVKPSQLANSFYRTVERVTAAVNSQAKNLYTKESKTVSTIFAVLGALLLVVMPITIMTLQISLSSFTFTPFIAVVPCVFVYLLALSFKYYSLKLSKNYKLLFTVGIVLLCAIFSAIYAFVVPNWIASFVPCMIVCFVGCLVCAISVVVIMRTDEYTEKLNGIVGFKEFIMLAEKERLETLIEEDPQYYYHVLPYAQVLGVSDKWEEKFKDITVQPPTWATSSAFNTVIEFHIINSILRNSMANVSRQMVSRPSSSGGSGRGGFGGGFGGGHVGGGHGGGGFRGR